MSARRRRVAARLAAPVAALGLLAATGVAGCADPESGARDGKSAPAEAPLPDRVGVLIGGEPFDLELALDPAVRYRGLSGRGAIPPNRGMLFVFPEPRRLDFVMRDCAAPIDIAFIDDRGRIVATHEMSVEAPRGPDESASDYDQRLRRWSSGVPVRFAIETAGGRLAALGVRPGQQLAFDTEALVRRAR